MAGHYQPRSARISILPVTLWSWSVWELMLMSVPMSGKVGHCTRDSTQAPSRLMEINVAAGIW